MFNASMTIAEFDPELAKAIARAPQLPDIAMPILVGGFIFAADLVRALAREVGLGAVAGCRLRGA